MGDAHLCEEPIDQFLFADLQVRCDVSKYAVHGPQFNGVVVWNCDLMLGSGVGVTEPNMATGLPDGDISEGAQGSNEI
jgi:hypothetical protein